MLPHGLRFYHASVILPAVKAHPDATAAKRGLWSLDSFRQQSRRGTSEIAHVLYEHYIMGVAPGMARVFHSPRGLLTMQAPDDNDMSSVHRGGPNATHCVHWRASRKWPLE